MALCPKSPNFVVKLCAMDCQHEALRNALLAHQQGCLTSRDAIYNILQGFTKKDGEDLAACRLLHCLMLESGLSFVSALGDHLIRAFASSETLLEANLVFCHVPNPSVHTWYAIISASAGRGENHIALSLYHKMKKGGEQPTKYIILCVLKVCASLQILEHARLVHQDIILSSLDSDTSVSNMLIDLYVKCRSLEEARIVFEHLRSRDTGSWNVMISGYAQHGHGPSALNLFNRMLQQGTDADIVTFLCSLKACVSIGAVDEGRIIHSQIIASELDSDISISTTLIDLYATCVSLEDARLVFDKLPTRTVVTWSTMICGYVQHGYEICALELFEKMEQEGLQADKLLLMWVLKACASEGAILHGMVIHDQIIHYKLESDIVCASTLADMYARCGSRRDACQVFETVLIQAIFSWDKIITGKQTVPEVSKNMEDFFKFDKVPISCMIRACGSLQILNVGKIIHQQLIKSGLESDYVVGTTLIDMYMRCGSFEEAHNVFEKLSCQDTVSWNALIGGYVKHGNISSAHAVFDSMTRKGMMPDNVTFLCMLKACTKSQVEGQGKVIHSWILKCGLDLDINITSTLVDMYAKCGWLEEAHQVLQGMPNQNVVAWTALISGYADHGCGFLSLDFFWRMQEDGILPTRATFSSILKACRNIQAVKQGRSIHKQIIASGFDFDVGVGNSLLDMYIKCGSLEEAHKEFVRMPVHDVVSRATMIAGYCAQGKGLPALELFEKSLHDGITCNKVLLSSTLKACSILGALDLGRLLHEQAINNHLELDTEVGNSLIDLYIQLGSLGEADEVFETLLNKDVVSWGSIITGYVQHGRNLEALNLFDIMLREQISPNEITFVSILKACTGTKSLTHGRLIYHLIIECGLQSDMVIGNTLVAMYTAHGCLDEAQKVFNNLSVPRTDSWNALMSGYLQHGDGFGALEVFEQIKHAKVMPDAVTYICSLKACGILGAVWKGRVIHADLLRSELDLDVQIGTTLIDMYAKCGSIDEARQVFDELSNRNLVSWSTMVAAYGRFGNFIEVGHCVETMQEFHIMPDDRTNSIILSSFGHSGRVNDANVYYENMRKSFHAKPINDHFNCLVDLLGRMGCLDMASELVKTVPWLPDVTGWMSLLTSCKRVGHMELGKICFDQLLHLYPNTGSGYELMLNLYRDAHMSEDTQKTQELRKFANAWKKPGKAWIEHEHQVHEFTVGGHHHPDIDLTHFKVECVRIILAKAGYIPGVDVVS